jgi:DNA-binding response OmpR family regulator
MKKILVIEDDSQTRDIFLECLKAEGFDAISAENGLVGVQRAQEQLPDLVIADDYLTKPSTAEELWLWCPSQAAPRPYHSDCPLHFSHCQGY